jgi:hypothetical protein
MLEEVTLHGRYDWVDCLHVTDLNGRHIGIYRHESALVNAKTHGTVTINYYLHGRFGRGDYEWGSTLDNVRASR